MAFIGIIELAPYPLLGLVKIAQSWGAEYEINKRSGNRVSIGLDKRDSYIFGA